jgi:hypothetical protein
MIFHLLKKVIYSIFTIESEDANQYGARYQDSYVLLDFTIEHD